MNYHKKGLKRLLNQIIDGNIGRLVLTHKDRLLRFGAELVFSICEIKQVEIVIINQGEDTSFEEDLAKDMLEIITVFSARLYGSRSRKNQKLLENVKKAAEQTEQENHYTMMIAHKIALKPNNRQRTYFAKACGVARLAYNCGLEMWQQQYQAHKENPDNPKPTEMLLRRQLNAIKREKFPFMLEVTKCAPQQAIKDLGKAFKNFWAGRAKYPQFRKKGHHDSFYLSNDQFKIIDNKIKIPNLGWVRMTENVRFSGKIMSATISRIADKWFVSITI